MAKGITYSATDSKGVKHSRYSAGHTTPLYTYVVVREPGGAANVHNVAYCSRRDLADKALAEAMNTRGGRKGHQNAEILILDARAGK